LILILVLLLPSILDKLHLYDFQGLTLDKLRGLSNDSIVLELWNLIEEGQKLGFKALDLNINNFGYKGTNLAIFDIMDHKQKKVPLERIY